MKLNTYVVSKQVETFCPSCNSFYMEYATNAVHSGFHPNGEKFYHATCYDCLNDRQEYEIYLAWQKLVFVNKTLSFNLSPLYKLYK